MNRKFWTKAAYILTTVLVFGVFLYLSLLPSFRSFVSEIENKTFDLRQGITSKYISPSDKITIIDVDDESYEYIVDKFGSWPVPRVFWADLITNLEPARPNMLVFDLLFLKRFTADGDSDFELINAVNKNKNV